MLRVTETTAGYEFIRLEIHAGVAVLTLNRPERKNAFTVGLLVEVEHALASVDADPQVRAVVLTGAGTAFSVGADLHGANTLRDAMAEDVAGHVASGYREPAGRITERIFGMRIPVIAAINGDAVGGGATITAAADVRIASESARFGFVFTRRGVTPEGASTWFLPRLVGLTRATDWLISGRVFGAVEALAAGFVTSICPEDVVLDQAMAYARQFTESTSPQSVALTRQLLGRSWASPYPGLTATEESRVYSSLVDSADAREGILSFLERRTPEFHSTGIAPPRS